jgi:hypothetical protein
MKEHDMPAPRTVSILIDDNFKIKVINQDCRRIAAVKLTRIEAQRLADALLEFARGWGVKGRTKMFSGEEITSR